MKELHVLLPRLKMFITQEPSQLPKPNVRNVLKYSCQNLLEVNVTVTVTVWPVHKCSNTRREQKMQL
jgi:hypothetical protein